MQNPSSSSSARSPRSCRRAPASASCATRLVPSGQARCRTPPTRRTFVPAKPLKIRTPATFRAPENPSRCRRSFRLPGMPTKETAPTSYFSSSCYLRGRSPSCRRPACPEQDAVRQPVLVRRADPQLRQRRPRRPSTRSSAARDADHRRDLYGGVDVRRMVQAAIPRGTSVLDLCCGVGYSVAPGAVGVGTSSCFLDAARLLQLGRNATFVRGNAETYGKTPARRRHHVRDARDAARGAPACSRTPADAPAGRRRRHRPGVQARADDRPAARRAGEGLPVGEPYALDYLAAIDTDVVRCARERGWQSSTQAVLPGHVRMY